ncbi:hypothetical protein H1R20_g12727, partial [Candolleomyces eurysporus]
MGWRYFLYAVGGLMIVIWAWRCFIFRLYETPKYLMGKGRYPDAVASVHSVAGHNGRTSNLTLEDLERVDLDHGFKLDEKSHDDNEKASHRICRQMAKLDANHIKSLFATKELALTTTLLIVIWSLIGLAFPLYNNFLTYFTAALGQRVGDGSLNMTYRNQVIIYLLGIPGALLAGYTVEMPLLGRRGTLAIASCLTGIFTLLATTARSSNAFLGWNCAISFSTNITYGVLYAITPELFPTKDRGTGNAITATANRIFGIMAPVIALYANLNSHVPIYVAGSVYVVAGLTALLLPYDSRGQASL